MISAVLLAAGESLRMGDFKQLLDFQGKTFVACCADNLLGSRADEVIVVTGHREADVRSALAGRPVRFAHNEDYRSGMSSSVKRGIEAVSKEARACLVALVDQPQITTEIINRVLEAYEKTGSFVVIPTYDGRNGHPILLDMSLRDEILGIAANEGLRQVVHAHKPARIAVSTEAVLVDFDFPEDYRRISKI